MNNEKCVEANLPCFITEHEVLVNLEKYWINKKKARRKRNKFKKRFRSQGQKDLKNIRDVMPMKDIKDCLWKAAYDDAKKLPKDSEFITGMRVFMGMKDNQSLQLIYRSEYVIRKPDNEKGKFQGFATPVEGAKYYHEFEGRLVELDKNLAKMAKDRYKKKILMKHIGLGPWEGYHDGDEDYHDTKSIFFSFQEIFALYHKAYIGSADDDTYENLMTISSASRLKSRIPVNPFRRAKHVLVISARNGEKKMNIGPAEDDDGNLGHVCPPDTNCESIDYEI